MNWRDSNKTCQILALAEKGGYGVLAAIVYNVEHITAMVEAAEQRRSPLIIQLFPSSLKQTPSLVFAASAAAKSASVPISVHLDHAQDYEQINYVADNLPFDSIMSRRRPAGLKGREDGIMDTGDLAGILTNPEDVEEFISSGVDFLAPSVGNVHGDYGPKGPELDMERLHGIFKSMNGRVRLVLHGTNDFPPKLTQECIKAGVTKVNVNKLVLDPWHDNLRANVTRPLTDLMDTGIQALRTEMERWMDIIGSSGRA
ncbi:fructose-bisphosphate aldolase [Penicillium lividum]|nr:fructose-bisphosphate aldolase [Penicillium lividum]